MGQPLCYFIKEYALTFLNYYTSLSIRVSIILYYPCYILQFISKTQSCKTENNSPVLTTVIYFNEHSNTLTFNTNFVVYFSYAYTKMKWEPLSYLKQLLISSAHLVSLCTVTCLDVLQKKNTAVNMFIS